MFELFEDLTPVNRMVHLLFKRKFQYIESDIVADVFVGKQYGGMCEWNKATLPQIKAILNEY